MVIAQPTQVGNPIITNISGKIDDPTAPEIQQLIHDLTDTMRAVSLVGMAAPQIGKNLRVFVTEIRPTPIRNPKDVDKLRVYINPEITWMSEETEVGYEGCGSVAHSDLMGQVERAKELIVKAYDETGKEFELKASGLLARCIQHENDHLNGIVFAFRLFDTKTIMSRDEYIERIVRPRTTLEE